MNTSFLVPTFMDEKTDQKLIKKLQNHLNMLDEQKCAMHVMNLFKKFSNLKHFSFEMDYESNDEGGTNLCVFFDEDDVELHNSEKESIEDVIYKLDDYLMKYAEKYESFFEKLSCTKLTASNIEKKVASAMGKKKYEAWMELRQAWYEKSQLEANVNDNKSKTANNIKI